MARPLRCLPASAVLHEGRQVRDRPIAGPVRQVPRPGRQSPPDASPSGGNSASRGTAGRKKGPDIIRALAVGPGSLTLSLKSRMNAHFCPIGICELSRKLSGSAARWPSSAPSLRAPRKAPGPALVAAPARRVPASSPPAAEWSPARFGARSGSGRLTDVDTKRRCGAFLATSAARCRHVSASSRCSDSSSVIAHSASVHWAGSLGADVGSLMPRDLFGRARPFRTSTARRRRARQPSWRPPTLGQGAPVQPPVSPHTWP